MAVVSFKPTKARLVIEHEKESVLVMLVVVTPGDAVALSGGGSLQSLTGTLRVRERRGFIGREGTVAGSLSFVGDVGATTRSNGAKFQIEVVMGPRKFDALLKVALSGRLPNKFFVDVGGGMTYRPRGNSRIKYWDVVGHRKLAITNFVMILPVEVPETPGGGTSPAEDDEIPLLGETVATNAQVAELAGDIAVFAGETRHLLTAVVMLSAVIGITVAGTALWVLLR